MLEPFCQKLGISIGDLIFAVAMDATATSGAVSEREGELVGLVDEGV